MTATAAGDALVIGGGLIGLACAVALARDGARVTVVDDRQPGAASPAAAGMLAPSIDQERGAAHDFAIAARDRYPAYLAWLASETGVAVPINARGILQVALSVRGERGVRRAMPAEAHWIDRTELASVEPALAHALGAVHHLSDGAVDNVVLLRALTQFCAMSPRVTVVREQATSVRIVSGAAQVGVSHATRYAAPIVVLAAGAWAATTIAGLPRPLPVSPARGQMLAYPPFAVRHVLFGPRGYIVPRVDENGAAVETLVGATTEWTGFDASTSMICADRLRAIGEEILPQLGSTSPLRQWAGLRPMTPDLRPIIGADPEEPALIYACGHSRNGILLAPATGDCVSSLARGEPSPHDLSPFRVDRFPVRGASAPA